MKDSIIYGALFFIYRRLLYYYSNSWLCLIMARMSRGFGELAAGSAILGFFNREWNIGRAWKNSFTVKVLLLPLRLFGYLSSRLSDRTNSVLNDSRALNRLGIILENLYRMNSRVYGLLLLAFAVVHGLLELALNYGEVLDGTKAVVRLALFLMGTILILINRPVNSLVEGSIAGHIIWDFLTVSGSTLSNTVEDTKPRRTIENKSFEVSAAIAGAVLGILAYFLPVTSFVLVAGGFIGCIMVLWRYEIGVYAVVAAIPVAPTTALLGLILVTAAAYAIRLFRDKTMKFRVSILDYFVVLFGIVLLYSTVTSYTQANSMLSLVIHMAYILFYFILVNTIKNRQQLYLMIALLVLSTTLISLYGLYQLKTVGATSEAWIDTTLFEDIKARVGSTFENPNVLGEYLVLIIPIAIAMLWGQKRWISRLVTLGLIAIMLACLVYTYSRGAYVALMLTFAVFAVFRDKRFVILGIIGLMMLPFVLPPSVINRFTSIGNLSDSSSYYRISVLLGSWKIVQDYWPSGIGLGLEPFKLIYPKYSLNAAYAHHSHNIYIQLLIETGIAGFVVFLAMMVVYYKATLTGFYKTKDRFVSTFMIAVASGMTGYLAQGMVENIWYNNKVLLTFWVMLAFGMIAKALITKDNEVLEV